MVETRSIEERRMDAQDMIEEMGGEPQGDKPPTRYRIVLIGKADVFYWDRKELIGKEGTVTMWGRSHGGGWWSCEFLFDDSEFIVETFGRRRSVFFYKVLLKRLGKRKVVVE